MNGMAVGTAREEWRRHWTVVLAGLAGMSLSAIPSYGLGLFIHPLETEFGWSRAGISAALTIFAVVNILTLPAGGWLLDRIGARRLGVFGVICYCSGLALLSLATSSIWSWWALWVLVGLTGIGIKTGIWSKAITSFFHHGRGVAVAVMASGGGVAAIFLPRLVTGLIEPYGWRVAMVGMAATFLAVVLPLLWLFLYDSTDRAVKDRTVETRVDAARTLPGWSAKEGLRKRQFWQLGIAALIATGTMTALTVHIIPIMVQSGMPRSQAVTLFSLVGFLSVAARLTVGFIFDRVSHPLVGALSIAGPGVPALFLLLLEPTTTTMVLAVVALGIAIGGEYDAVIYLCSRFFGVKAFGVLFSIVGSMVSLGVAIGPLLAGRTFDLTGSYELFLMGTVPACALAGLLVYTLGRYPDHGRTASH